MLRNVILDRPPNIFKRSCRYCKCIYVLTSTFLWILRMLCDFFFVCLFLCLFMFNVTTHRALDIYFWPTSETRGHIFQKISRRTSSYAPIAMRCREDRINRFGRAAERGTETGKARRYATLAEGLAAKQTYRTSWRRGVQPHLTMDVTRLRSAFFVCRRPHEKKVFC